MLKKQFLTVSGIVAATSSLVLFFAGFPVTAGIIAAISFFLPFKDFEKYSSNFQLFAFWLGGVCLAVVIDFPFREFPWLAMAVLISVFSFNIRGHLWKQLGYSTHTWIEVVTFLASLGLYIAGNISRDYGWQGWAMPSLLMLMGAYNAFGTVMGGNYLRSKAIRLGYAAQTGKLAPDFSLSDHEGKMISLSSYKGLNHLLLIFVKGDWCPGCHMMLRSYERNREKFNEKNVVVMAIGPDPVGVNREMVTRLGLKYHVLSDENQEVSGKYGIRIEKFPGAPKQQESTPLPASFLVCDEGYVRYSSRPDRAGEFLNPSLIFPVLESL